MKTLLWNVSKFRLVLASFAAAVTFAHVGSASALSNSANVPILLYHPGNSTLCNYADNALKALAADLTTMYANGYTVVPVYWIAQWVVGDLDGSQLPDKVVGITFDDGANEDWFDTDWGCGSMSGRSVLNDFKSAHPDLPWYSPHATLFVIASQIARADLGGLRSDWWSSAQTSGIMEIYNHSLDHDHSAITSQQWDPFVQSYIAVGGYGDGNWAGTNSFERIDSYVEADAEVRKAAAYIQGEIGVWPDLFAYPEGHHSDYILNTYFPTYTSEHQTYAAFCLGDTYASRSSPRYCIPRFTFNSAWGRAHNDSDTIMSILNGAP